MKKEEGKKYTGHKIKKVLPSSIAMEVGIEAGDWILTVNGKEIQDIFDYQYYMEEEYVEVLVRKSFGEEWLLEIDKEEDEDLGITFESGLMDEYRSCKNKCIFCFIDQMPKGMRETLYFKDDDTRLSFLQGNYVTLTNLSDEDIERIIRYRLSPMNISFQTTNPKLRSQMLNNRFAGEALNKANQLYKAGISMNGQIVLCKGVNDKKELHRSIDDLTKYAPVLQSLSVVPVGLSKYREGLYPLSPFSKKDAKEVIALVEKYQKEMMKKWGIHFVHCSDEWYILAEKELPLEEQYDGYLQLENGVGMLRLFLTEFEEALLLVKEQKIEKEVSLATGRLAYPFIKKMAERLMDKFQGLKIHSYEIKNEFFGENITVSGLITGQDLERQLLGKPLGQRLLIPENMLRCEEYGEVEEKKVFLDDKTVGELEKALQVKIDIVKSSGQDFIDKITKKA